MILRGGNSIIFLAFVIHLGRWRMRVSRFRENTALYFVAGYDGEREGARQPARRADLAYLERGRTASGRLHIYD